MIYCLVGRPVPDRVRTAVARVHQYDPDVVVISERRGLDRRRAGERRCNPWDPGFPRLNRRERRSVYNLEGRRVAERRGVLVPTVGVLELPRVARRWADHISFAGLLTGTPDWHDEVASERLVVQVQLGDLGAFEHLYKLWFDRVYRCLRTRISDVAEVEEALQNVFARLFDSLAEYDPRSTSFRCRLASIIAERREPGFEIPDDDQERWADRWPDPASQEVFDWLPDEELFLLVGRLPSRQREIVALHYILGVSPAHLADVLGLPQDAVNDLHDRALRFMRACVAAASGRPGYSGRHPMSALPRAHTVLRHRRLALVP